MNVSFQEIGQVCATFLDAGVSEGQVCKVSAAGTVRPCATGDRFCGAVLSRRGGYAGVALAGFVQVPYTGTAPAVGYAGLSADGSGGVKADAAGQSYLVVEADTAAKTVCLYL